MPDHDTSQAQDHRRGRDADVVLWEDARSAEASEQAERVCVWGAGRHGRWMIQLLGSRCVGVIDSNPLKWGTVVDGHVIRPPEAIAQVAHDAVHVCVLSDWKAIVHTLTREHGIDSMRLRIPFRRGAALQFADRAPDYLRALEKVPVGGSRILEIGAGGNFFLATLLVVLGAERVLSTNPEAVAETALQEEVENIAYLMDALRTHGLERRDVPTAEALIGHIEVVPEPVDAASLPYADDSIDACLSKGVWEHLEKPLAALQEMARVIRPGGVLAGFSVGIHDHRANDPDSGFTPWSFYSVPMADWSANCTPYHQNRWRPTDFRASLTRLGLEVLYDYSAKVQGPDRAQVAVFAPEFRERYTAEELAELDFWIVARRPLA